MPEIDRFLPEWDVNEVHAVVVSAAPERALAAALAANCAPGPARVLLHLRGLRFAGSIEDLFARLGFDVLAREPHEVVVGGSGAPWRPRGRIAAFERARPGTVRIAANFLAEPLADGADPALDRDPRRGGRRERAAGLSPLLAARRPVLRADPAALARRDPPRARMTSNRAVPLLALVGVTAIWGVTFVQVQDALELYPLFAFLAVRFAISTAALAPFAWRPLRTMPREGIVAGIGVGVLLAAAYGFQTAGLELTTVSSTGFITGLYVVFTPLPRARRLRDAGAARRLARGRVRGRRPRCS